MSDFKGERLQKSTHVLFRIGNTDEYIMTNDSCEEKELLRVFTANQNGKINCEGLSLGSLFENRPDITLDLQDINCTFLELNHDFFERNLVADGLLGLAVGDAFGVPFEFLSRKEVGKFNLDEIFSIGNARVINSCWGRKIPFGAWSDDTSMTVAAMASIVKNQGQIDYDNIMKQFISWWYEGEYTSLGFPFGLGNNISKALNRYRSGIPALECGGNGFRDNGNGALMRIFPFAIYCILNGFDDKTTLEIISNAAKITHAHEINIMSCYLYTLFLRECIRTKNPIIAFREVFCYNRSNYSELFSDEAIKAHGILFSDDFERINFDCNCINESGYVVDSLTTAIYSIMNTEDYKHAIKTAIKLGYDTDTNAAITGSIAGSMYGMSQIPEEWLNYLKKKDKLISLSNDFAVYTKSNNA